MLICETEFLKFLICIEQTGENLSPPAGKLRQHFGNLIAFRLFVCLTNIMAKEKTASKEKPPKVRVSGGGSGAIYGLGLIGVAIYYIQHATTFWVGMVGVIKAIFWPAVLLYKVFDMLHL